MVPLIIEAALNGVTPKARNPHVPTSPAEIAADALACISCGAAIIHTHVDDGSLNGPAAADAYLEGWRPVFAAKPDAVIYGTIASGERPEIRFGHYSILAKAGMRMGALDPGSLNIASHGSDGLPGAVQIVYSTSFADIAYLMDEFGRSGLGPSIAIYEPGFLRVVVAYHKAGKLPPGALVKLYFGGPYNVVDGQASDITFGLPPTETALDAYLEMITPLGIPWAVTVLGGDVTGTGLAKLAIERGGHVRVGLEDFAGDRCPGNVELVREVVALADAAGRRVATSSDAAEILCLPRAPARKKVHESASPQNL